MPNIEVPAKTILRVHQVDSTLREGVQQKGIWMSPANQIIYAAYSSNFGVPVIELPHPASNDTAYTVATKIIANGGNAVFAPHVRLDERDVLGTLRLFEEAKQLALQDGKKVDPNHLFINTYIPMDPKNVQAKLDEHLPQLEKIAQLAKDAGVGLRVGVEFAFSLNDETLSKIYRIISNVQGVNRVSIADTAGICSTRTFESKLATVIAAIPDSMPIQVHMHNDNGLAAAKFETLLFLIAATDKEVYIDTSFDGHGERNGIVSHGDMLAQMYLINRELLKKMYKIETYAEWVSFYEQATKTKLSSRDPLNQSMFAQVAGPHSAGTLDNNRYRPIDPKDFGFEEEIIAGSPVSGWQALNHLITKELGVKLPEKNLKAMSKYLKNWTAENGLLSNEQVIDLLLSEFQELLSLKPLSDRVLATVDG